VRKKRSERKGEKNGMEGEKKEKGEKEGKGKEKEERMKEKKKENKPSLASNLEGVSAPMSKTQKV